MAGLTIAWEYLTGYAVSTDPVDRNRPEWPPHPARVFMALAAAWFETGEPEDEGAALRELERLGPPELILPARSNVFERSSVTLYVPVNDKNEASAAKLQSAPAVTRNKQARTLPRNWIGHFPCRAKWPVANAIGPHVEALDRLCAKVTRLGHSSSLVRMWIEPSDALGLDEQSDHYAPTTNRGAALGHLRVASAGLLDSLPAQTRVREIERFAELDLAIRSGGGKEQKSAKAEFEAAFGEPWRSATKPPPFGRPNVRTESAYTLQRQPPADAEHSGFDHHLAILRVTSGMLPAAATLRVTSLLRKTVIKRVEEKHRKLAWINGHDPNGGKQTGDDGHVAYAPLVNVGHEHSDGALLGIAIVFPNAWKNLEERDEVFSPLLGSDAGIVLKVKQGPRVATLQPIDFNETRWTLAPEAWTSSPRGARVWASATPVVLDRFPKAERSKDRVGWTNEVAALIISACERIELPPPLSVEIDTTSWLSGAPRAYSKRRSLRGQPGVDRDAPLGDGYPFFPAKTGSASRPQVHARVEFAEPVVGPVLLGAGRFLGYGLFKPLAGGG
ncbi:CRISPR-associated protein, family (Cas_GSU0054) [Posidoniimonas corsicana]|uniref:CRISPR-associated protein, family (Cas_GSU0054) n=1 Tax=Posidoniimonas corsicana TaxID=1938618 RepID=A0A5C5UUG6_9BACT|nr:type I-U CRISPR-associated protein Csb2 [Posidoniimonas corsicana]TWT29172.1 CRISPR-associated protein, family (Cas_GSU0054) [Posidoniimonas corsicana]